MIENPFIANLNTPQEVSWKHFISAQDKKENPRKSKLEYHLEFILPFRCIIEELGREGAYMVLCAEVRANQELFVSEVQQGQMIVISIPVRTFTRAWLGINRTFREQFTEEDNFRIKFVKDSRKAMTIKEIERLKPSEEQITFAKKIYGNVTDRLSKRHHNTIVREGEEL